MIESRVIFYVVVCLQIADICSDENMWKICVPKIKKENCDKFKAGKKECHVEKDEMACLKKIVTKNYDVTLVRSDTAYAASKDFNISDKLQVYAIGYSEKPPFMFKVKFNTNGTGKNKMKVLYPSFKSDTRSYYQLPFNNFENAMLEGYNYTNYKNDSLMEKLKDGLSTIFGDSIVTNYWEIMINNNTRLTEHEQAYDIELNITNFLTKDTHFVSNEMFQTCLRERNSPCHWVYKDYFVIGVSKPYSEKLFRTFALAYDNQRKKKDTEGKVTDLFDVKTYDFFEKTCSLKQFPDGCVSSSKPLTVGFLEYNKSEALNRTVRWCTNNLFFERCKYIKHIAYYNGVFLDIDCIKSNDCLESVRNNSADFTTMDIIESLQYPRNNLDIFAYNIMNFYKFFTFAEKCPKEKKEYCQLEYSSEDLPILKSVGTNFTFTTIKSYHEVLKCFENNMGNHAFVVSDGKLPDVSVEKLEIVCKNESISLGSFLNQTDCDCPEIPKEILFIRKEYPEFARNDLKFMLQSIEMLKLNENWFHFNYNYTTELKINVANTPSKAELKPEPEPKPEPESCWTTGNVIAFAVGGALVGVVVVLVVMRKKWSVSWSSSSTSRTKNDAEEKLHVSATPESDDTELKLLETSSNR